MCYFCSRGENIDKLKILEMAEAKAQNMLFQKTIVQKSFINNGGIR